MSTSIITKPYVVAIIQARLTSSRLPKKVLAKLGKWRAIELMWARLARAKNINKFVFALPDNNENAELYRFIKSELTTDIVLGSESDVLSRYALAADNYPSDYYVRLTADCPLISPEVTDKVVELALQGSCDYVSNVEYPTYPNGFDVEVLTAGLLRRMDLEVTKPIYREHVTLAARDSESGIKNLRKKNLLSDDPMLANYRITLDTSADLSFICKLVENFGERIVDAKPDEIYAYLRGTNISV